MGLEIRSVWLRVSGAHVLLDFRRVGSVRRQPAALQCGEFGIGAVVRHPVVLHVDMHVLPGFGARGHDRRVGRRTAVAVTVGIHAAAAQSGLARALRRVRTLGRLRLR